MSIVLEQWHLLQKKGWTMRQELTLSFVVCSQMEMAVWFQSGFFSEASYQDIFLCRGVDTDWALFG